MRFCTYKCKPAELRLGSMCTRLSGSETVEKMDVDGNGDSASGQIKSVTGLKGWDT